MSSDRDIPVLVIGAGSWGTALAVLLAGNGVPTLLWSREPDHLREMARTRTNTAFLPGILLPPALEPEPDLARALTRTRDLLIAVPSAGFRSTLRTVAAHDGSALRLAWATKGFDPGTGKLLHEVITEELPQTTARAIISGPTFAMEVARGLPTAVTVAADASGFATSLAARFASDHFRVYTGDDIIGVSVGGAVKNVLAIAAGIADGMGLGANTRAALVTRGLAEITRLGVALGGRRETFTGLAGLGDLVLTCTDDQSRNRKLGLALGRGRTLTEASGETHQVIEGVETVREVIRLARKHDIDMPISNEVFNVIHQGKSPREALKALLSRERKAEDVV
ncbi:MAG: NAD(P)-dependent glycerol-3-phosphate dehydrogenase [Chromatiales bacterium]|jgi:glycerol-3-phosphate dehydrogenase (NAD(P)+)|nr:NAD(P)-dependent glycerol-3-phosphate dehydrogenase [Chromatiales bacterium]